MLFNPRYRAVGLVALPALLIFEVIGPLIELAGYGITTVLFATGGLALVTFLLFLAVAVLYGLLLTLGSIALEDASLGRHPGWDDLRRLVLFSLVESLGYRQMTHLWKLEGFWQLMRKGDWGTMERKGLARSEPTAEITLRSSERRAALNRDPRNGQRRGDSAGVGAAERAARPAALGRGQAGARVEALGDGVRRPSGGGSD
jgi:hypothetical protein